MKPAIAVVDVNGIYKVHTEFYASPLARKTIILVNGSMATTASFAQTVKTLQPQFNVVLFDLPYAGRSRQHNDYDHLISKDDEANILLELIEHFKANFLMSFSWGSVAALLALAKRPARIEQAVISSFSPVLNEPMLDYMNRGLTFLEATDRENIGELVNSTIGKFLPSLFKRYNYRHVSSLHEHEYRQMHAHIKQVMRMESNCQMPDLARIDIPLLFINGENDEYTTAHDARLFGEYLPDCRFATIENAGHFLDMEHKSACEQTRDAICGFLQSTRPVERLHYPQMDVQHAAMAV